MRVDSSAPRSQPPCRLPQRRCCEKGREVRSGRRVRRDSGQQKLVPRCSRRSGSTRYPETLRPGTIRIERALAAAGPEAAATSSASSPAITQSLLGLRRTRWNDPKACKSNQSTAEMNWAHFACKRCSELRITRWLAPVAAEYAGRRRRTRHARARRTESRSTSLVRYDPRPNANRPAQSFSVELAHWPGEVANACPSLCDGQHIGYEVESSNTAVPYGIAPVVNPRTDAGRHPPPMAISGMCAAGPLTI
jgi:hypothetical protein